MHKQTLILGLVLSLFSLFLFATKALAGGGPVVLQAFPLRPFSETQSFIVEVNTYTYGSCENVSATYALLDPVSGDSITPYTPPDDGTYIQRHFYLGNNQYKEICTDYVKVVSGEKRQRTFTDESIIDGVKSSRQIAIAFGEDYISKQIQTYGRVNDYDNSPHLDIISETYISPTKRGVSLQWQKIPWATKYAVFGAKIESPVAIPLSQYTFLTSAQDPKIEIALGPFSTYYIIAIACKAEDPCNTIKENMNGPIYLERMRNISNAPVEIVVTKDPQDKTPNSTPIPTINIEEKTDPKVEELNQKVTELEGKLAESQKRQNALEQALNNLIMWLKTHIPFFR